VPPADDPGHAPAPSLSIPEIRDYQRINAELKVLLDQGHRRVRLEGAEGQRLLVAGLAGPWSAVVEVEGRTGPEFAANLDAPGLVVVAQGPTADGAARGLRSGVVIVLGPADDAAGAAQAGGTLIIAGPVGHRVGLGQSGGSLVLLGPTGRLPGERQAGGTLYFRPGNLGPHAGRGRRGGRRVEILGEGSVEVGAPVGWGDLVAIAAPWLDLSASPRS